MAEVSELHPTAAHPVLLCIASDVTARLLVFCDLLSELLPICTCSVAERRTVGSALVDRADHRVVGDAAVRPDLLAAAVAVEPGVPAALGVPDQVVLATFQK